MKDGEYLAKLIHERAYERGNCSLDTLTYKALTLKVAELRRDRGPAGFPIGRIPGLSSRKNYRPIKFAEWNAGVTESPAMLPNVGSTILRTSSYVPQFMSYVPY
jgi:hypothetical protein